MTQYLLTLAVGMTALAWALVALFPWVVMFVEVM